MNKVFTIKSEENLYVALSVPKNSKSHALNITDLAECYVTYKLETNSVVFMPHLLQVDAEIVGLASSISNYFKELLINNGILLKEWVNNEILPIETHEELLIIELPED